MATQDYYEILQVHPRADDAALEAAYRRVCELYDPGRLEGAADELVRIARQKREAADQAYAALSDPARRAAYDAQRAEDAGHTSAGTAEAVSAPAAPGDALDYRPLPPARRQERPRGFDEQPRAPRDRLRPQIPPAFAMLLVAAAVVLPAVVVGLAMTGGGATPQAVATPTPSAEDQFETLISQAKAFTDQNPQDARGWIDYANLLYDSAQIVREQAPDSVLYQQRLPRWLEAAAAYDRALQLDPTNYAVLADKGASACFYGAGAGDTQYVDQGLADTGRALEQAPQEPRVLLSHGYCLVSTRPPRTAEAIAGWQKLLEIVPADSQLAGQAQELIKRYSQ